MKVDCYIVWNSDMEAVLTSEKRTQYVFFYNVCRFLVSIKAVFVV